MNLNNSLLIELPNDSTIFNISTSPSGELWAAVSSGLYKREPAGWLDLQNTLPLQPVGLVLAQEKRVLAAGLEQGLVVSSDSGVTWSPVWMGQAHQAVTCLLPSPNYSTDGVLLAGTGGDGLLRSVNGGRSWSLCNFGLRSFVVLCLAAAGEWAWREPVFAGTEDGLYYSPNGGRAWKFSGLPGKTVLSIALHPQFPENPIVLAGLESEGLWRSEDAGKTWQGVDLGLQGEVSVNAIHFLKSTINLGTSDYGMIHSDNGGQTWEAVSDGPASVMCLALQSEINSSPQVPAKLYAGSHGEGLWVSIDEGRSWQVDN